LQHIDDGVDVFLVDVLAAVRDHLYRPHLG
jgi:hypothetical protein